MKPIFLFLVLLFCLQPAFAQNKVECGYFGKKTVEQRNAVFPFNKAKKVVLISYVNNAGKTPPTEITDTLAYLKKVGAIKKLRFSLKEHNFFYVVKEEAILNLEGIDRLSNILINYQLKKKPITAGFPPGNLCSYNPHNAVLFYDENDVIICCYEVCFECQDSLFLPDPAQLANAPYCREARIDEIKKLFINYGIQYLGNSQ